ncbi:RNA polymerase sigma-70 factor, ECF subfamily [Streptomyces sp. DvalAA-14]|nr:RNA polymerase sigma-70 factor, ECF subfamily [Streptomyces sp. DvalAA-14]
MNRQQTAVHQAAPGRGTARGAGRARGIGTARSEETAVIRSQESAASELFEAVYPRLAGWCRRLVDDDGTAHEIASEAFTRLWARWTKVEEPTGFLYVTAANLVRDHWRKMERERRAMRRVRTEEAVKRQPESADPSVRMLVQSLPERLRDPALLYYYADLPVREVAALLGRNEGTVKADLHAARELLRAKLGGRHDRIS